MNKDLQDSREKKYFSLEFKFLCLSQVGRKGCSGSHVFYMSCLPPKSFTGLVVAWIWPNSSRFHPGDEQSQLNSSHAAVNDSGSALLPIQLIYSWGRGSNQRKQSGWTGGNYWRHFNSLVKILMLIRQAAVETFHMLWAESRWGPVVLVPVTTQC